MLMTKSQHFKFSSYLPAMPHKCQFCGFFTINTFIQSTNVNASTSNISSTCRFCCLYLTDEIRQARRLPLHIPILKLTYSWICNLKTHGDGSRRMNGSIHVFSNEITFKDNPSLCVRRQWGFKVRKVRMSVALYCH